MKPESSEIASGKRLAQAAPLVGPPGRLKDGLPTPKGGLLDCPGLGLDDEVLIPFDTVTDV